MDDTNPAANQLRSRGLVLQLLWMWMWRVLTSAVAVVVVLLMPPLLLVILLGILRTVGFVVAPLLAIGGDVNSTVLCSSCADELAPGLRWLWLLCQLVNAAPVPVPLADVVPLLVVRF